MGWGTGAWGLSAWGIGAPTSSVFLAQTYAIANRIVRVMLSAPPLAGEPAVTGDALNPNSWSVIRLDTGQGLTVLDVDQIDDVTFDLHTMELLAEYQVDHVVEAVGLLDPSRSPVGPPTVFQFPGLLTNTQANDTARQAAKRAVATDLANPPFPVNGAAGGTLILGGSGDYVNVSGADLVRKLIYRRLTTNKGAFFYLPDYGFDLGPKKTFVPAQLPSIQAAIKQQILLEPEVEDASVVVIGDAANSILTVQAQVRMIGVPKPVPMSFIIPGAVIA